MLTTAKKRILCVDDDDDTCAMLTVFLGHAGYEVVAAQTADEGIRLASSQKFDAYLLDLWLRDGGKSELYKQIRTLDQKTPIVIYSADARHATRDNLLESNVQAFLTKPNGFDRLVETMNELTAQN